jgi:hypothetical protein
MFSRISCNILGAFSACIYKSKHRKNTQKTVNNNKNECKWSHTGTYFLNASKTHHRRFLGVFRGGLNFFDLKKPREITDYVFWCFARIKNNLPHDWYQRYIVFTLHSIYLRQQWSFTFYTTKELFAFLSMKAVFTTLCCTTLQNTSGRRFPVFQTTVLKRKAFPKNGAYVEGKHTTDD